MRIKRRSECCQTGIEVKSLNDMLFSIGDLKNKDILNTEENKILRLITTSACASASAFTILRLSLSLSLFLFMQTDETHTIHESMDFQIHSTMHIAHTHFGAGLTYFDENNPPSLTRKHRFKNVNYANYWENNKGCRIFVIGFLTKERIRNRQKARDMIVEQMKYVEEFVHQHPDKFAIARSPSEVRSLVTQTQKTIIVYSIEGGKSLIGSEEDALFWATKGVAFVTLMHMVDSELGGAAIRPGIIFS